MCAASSWKLLINSEGQEEGEKKKEKPTVAASASSVCAGDDVNSTIWVTLGYAGKKKKSSGASNENQIVVCFISNYGWMCPEMHLFTRAGCARLNICKLCSSANPYVMPV